MNQVIHISKNPEDLAEAFALQLIGWVNETDKGSFHLGLSGGKTPSLLFSLLADKYANEVPWQKIHLWWGDERMVPSDNPESNFAVVNKLLFSKIGLDKNQIHRIIGEADPTGEVKRYGEEIKSLVPMMNGWPAFDLIMLGMGDDGHTASIFPNQMELLESDQITGIATHPITGQKRITLTGNVLNNAKRVTFLISGESKAQIFNEIIRNTQNSSYYPASHIHPAGKLYWYVDNACYNGNTTKF